MDHWGTLTIHTKASWLPNVGPSHESSKSEKSVVTEEALEEYKVAGFEDGGRGTQAKKHGPLDAKKGRKQSPLEPPQMNAAILILSQLDQCQISDL